MKREAKIERKTKETDISLLLNLDGIDPSRVDTGIPFMDHMLDLMAALFYVNSRDNKQMSNPLLPFS